MDPLLFQTSIVAAFLGGMIALAAPCCVTFLLPAYLASAFRARYSLVAMTLVFAAGVAVILLPITLGVAALSRLTAEYHSEVFLLGGLFLVLLGAWSLAGRNFALPVHHSQLGDRPTVTSVFSLGVFSGAASSCCAPVLAGVLTLSAISSSLPQATALGLAYIAGMVSPLVVIALLWEKFNLSNTLLVRGRPVTFRLRAARWRIHSTNLLAGVLFIGVGLFVIGNTFTGGLETSQKQTQLGEYLRSAAETITNVTRGVPDVVSGGVLGALALVLIARTFGLGPSRSLPFARRRTAHPGTRRQAGAASASKETRP